MKNYTSPELELMSIASSDIITTSPGTETPEIDLGWQW